MSDPRFALPAQSPVPALAEAIAEAGGRAVIVGGWVRDCVLGVPPGDVDLEVYGLSARGLRSALARFGSVIRVGRSFDLYRVRGLAVDITLPRGTAEPSGPDDVPPVDFAEAARHRDLTANAMGFDPLTGELLDPHGGRDDLAARVLRATDRETFGSDPLRVLRVAQLTARLDLRPDAELEALCRELDIADVAAERILAELRKLLAAPRPSRGLAFLLEVGQLAFAQELASLVGVPQDPLWHPEGDVWIHTLMTVDAAAGLRTGDETEDERLLFAALCHDLGKPGTTQREGERIRSLRHDAVGAELSATLLERLRAPRGLLRAVAALVRHHLAPSQLVGQGAKPAAYRRLARKLAAEGVTLGLLERVARADHLGRTTADARAGRFEAGDRFLALARDHDAGAAAGPPAVKGRHVLARGVPPGLEVGRILERCRRVQDETGWADPVRILDRVLAEEGVD